MKLLGALQIRLAQLQTQPPSTVLAAIRSFSTPFSTFSGRPNTIYQALYDYHKREDVIQKLRDYANAPNTSFRLLHNSRSLNQEVNKELARRLIAAIRHKPNDGARRSSLAEIFDVENIRRIRQDIVTEKNKDPDFKAAYVERSNKQYAFYKSAGVNSSTLQKIFEDAREVEQPTPASKPAPGRS